MKDLREKGWLAFRAPASLGVADVIALKDGERSMLCEVKTDVRDAYSNFGPLKRERLAEAARLAGADAFFVWWPANKPAQWISATAWPTRGAA